MENTNNAIEQNFSQHCDSGALGASNSIQQMPWRWVDCTMQNAHILWMLPALPLAGRGSLGFKDVNKVIDVWFCRIRPPFLSLSLLQEVKEQEEQDLILSCAPSAKKLLLLLWALSQAKRCPPYHLNIKRLCLFMLFGWVVGDIDFNCRMHI